MRRVLNVISDSNIGGAGRVVLNYLAAADRARFETLVAMPRGSRLKEPAEALGGTVFELDGLAERSYHPDDVRALARLLRELKPDVVHTHGALSARIAARRCGVGAVVMTKHCAAAPGNAATRAAHRLLDPRFTDRMIAVTRAVGRQMAAAGTPEGMIRVVYNGICPAEPYAPAEREALRARLGMDAAHTWIGVAARLEPVKGVDRFIEAAKLLAQREELHFIVFGAGSEEERLRALAAPLGGRLRFAGFTNEIEQALGLLDLTVVPSRSEACSLTVIESLSVGTPVCAFAIDGMDELVRDGTDGLLAARDDVPALAAAAGRLADDAALRARMGENGRARARELFTAQTMARQIEEIYGQVLGEKERER